MEDERFDDLTRKLAMPVSRRGALKAFLGVTAGAVLLRASGSRAFADDGEGDKEGGDEGGDNQCTALGHKCHTQKKNSCCGGGVCLSTGEEGHNGVCACPSGTTVCGGTCTNLQTSNANCGACGTTCTTANVPGSTAVACTGGTCAATACASDLSLSKGKCLCGTGPACGTGSVCVNGTCHTSCGAGQTCGNYTPHNGQYCVSNAEGGTTTGLCTTGGVPPEQTCATAKCASSADCAKFNTTTRQYFCQTNTSCNGTCGGNQSVCVPFC